MDLARRHEQVHVIADVLRQHQRLKPPSGQCTCGHEVPLGRLFSEHQAREVMAALDDFAART
jgi:hypothetical protein